MSVPAVVDDCSCTWQQLPQGAAAANVISERYSIHRPGMTLEGSATQAAAANGSSYRWQPQIQQLHQLLKGSSY
jgi:hypothetical protein